MLQTQHGVEAAKMQRQIDELDNRVIRLQLQLATSQGAQQQQQRLEQREAAEGSDAIEPVHRPPSATDSLLGRSVSRQNSVSPTVVKSLQSPIPLDKLLTNDDAFKGTLYVVTVRTL